ncbi:MAG TPA: transporter substrate-binding domain-containing protein [Oligoflexus sp.]|uniref:substrate-binding periplasmic protein n=1 Tax=Oligoflexus sp. TaxID=1971216 RepID=UPI002D7F0CAD|nr:transporter substrate-binding domain-containing protein [Oligoflexus sp.]HET9238818.1 transporter substrate-binding domain-containing protein [Oligoflexus sp.]
MLRLIFKFMITALLAQSVGAQGKDAFRIAKMESPDHRLLMRIVSEAYDRLQIPIEFIEFPGKRSLYEANSGYVDADLSRIKDVEKEFPSLRRVPTSIFWFEATAFSKNKDLRINGWESLRDLRIGIMRGMVYAEKGVKGLPRVTIVDKPGHLFKMLESDRIDVAIFSDINGLALIKELKLSSIQALKPPLERIEAFHYVHKKHEALVPKLDAIFQEMKTSGQLDRMRQDFLRESIE